MTFSGEILILPRTSYMGFTQTGMPGYLQIQEEQDKDI